MFLITFRALLFCRLLSFNLATKIGFFDSEIDKIEVLDENSYEITLSQSDKATLLLVYTTWCKWSKVFEPTWREFANETVLWQTDIMRVSALECSLTNELKNFCAAKNANVFPTVRYIDVMTDNTKGVKVGEETMNADQFMNIAIDYIEKNSQKMDWPILEAYKKYLRVKLSFSILNYLTFLVSDYRRFLTIFT